MGNSHFKSCMQERLHYQGKVGVKRGLAMKRISNNLIKNEGLYERGCGLIEENEISKF